MFTIGAHISSAKGYPSMGRHALDLGASTLAFFTRNPRGGKARELDEGEASTFREMLAAHGFGPIIAHGAYTLNPCSVKENVREFTRETMRDDLLRLSQLPGNLYNFHPGSHGGQGLDVGIAQIAEVLCALTEEEPPATLLLETMAGGGAAIGGQFEELRRIIDQVPHAEKLGVCLDVCHVWDAGYDIQKDLDGVLTSFDRIIGLSRLFAVHLNESKNDRGSRRDRHARLGEGTIGLEAIARIVTHPALRQLPFVLETPNDDAGWAREIRMVREMAEG